MDITGVFMVIVGFLVGHYAALVNQKQEKKSDVMKIIQSNHPSAYPGEVEKIANAILEK